MGGMSLLSNPSLTLTNPPLPLFAQVSAIFHSRIAFLTSISSMQAQQPQFPPGPPSIFTLPPSELKSGTYSFLC